MIAGGLALAYFTVGGQVTKALYDRIDYELAKIRRSDIRIDFPGGRLAVLLNLRLFLKQSFGPTLTLTGVDLQFRQLGNSLGRIRTNESITLPNAKTVTVPLLLSVGVGSFADHLYQLITNRGGNSSPLAPIEITGSLHLSNGTSVPVSTSLNFFSFG